MAYEDREGSEKSVPPLIAQDNSGNPRAADLPRGQEQNQIWKTATFGPDARIVAELARVRRINRLFPPPSRGLIYFNFKANRVAVAAVSA